MLKKDIISDTDINPFVPHKNLFISSLSWHDCKMFKFRHKDSIDVVP